MLLKLIGVGLFFYLLRKVDIDEVRKIWTQANATLLLLAFAGLMIQYVWKVWRWSLLVESAGLKMRWHEAWKIFHIGVFLGNITPSNLGEFGRAAYLRARGVSVAAGIGVGVLDRLLDVIGTGILCIYAAGYYYGIKGIILGIVALGIAASVGSQLWKHTRTARQAHPWLQFLSVLGHPASAGKVALSFFLGWGTYFFWTIMLSRALGMDVPVHAMIAVLTLTGVVSLVPISPAGLGTRDATLLALLLPLGVPGSLSLAFSLSIFVYILLSSILGGLYWLTEKHHPKPVA
jgi:uncharacterized membrane protein YbhN (UPF0104 family)